MSRFLGRFGEKRFSLLCSEAGATCNPATEDDHGWDHVVQFPHRPVPGVSADMQRRIPAVFVQTKSHVANGLKVTMKLSNAVSLAKSPNPCFVVLATLPADSTPASWHAVHVWGDLLERILTRARTESRDGTAEKDFNKKDFSFTMVEADEIAEVDLVAWIEQTVTAAGTDYAAAKGSLIPPANMIIRADFGPLKSVDEFVDHTIGLTEHILINKLTMGERRLGVEIPIPTPFEVVDGGQIRAILRPEPTRQADIRLQGPDGTTIQMAADVYIPPRNVPSARVKCRFATPNLEIVWSPSGGITMNLKFSGGDRTSPQELEKILRLGSWAGRGEIDVRVSVDDEAILGATARLNTVADHEMLEILTELVEPLSRVSSHLRNKKPDISIDDVGSSERIELFHHFVVATSMTANAVVETDAPVPDVIAGIAVGVVKVGEWNFAAIQRFPITAQARNGDAWSIEFGKPVLVEPHAFPADDEVSMDRLREAYVRLASAPGVVSLGDVLPALHVPET